MRRRRRGTGNDGERRGTGNLIRLLADARIHLPQTGKAYGVFLVSGIGLECVGLGIVTSSRTAEGGRQPVMPSPRRGRWRQSRRMRFPPRCTPRTQENKSASPVGYRLNSTRWRGTGTTENGEPHPSPRWRSDPPSPEGKAYGVFLAAGFKTGENGQSANQAFRRLRQVRRYCLSRAGG